MVVLLILIAAFAVSGTLGLVLGVGVIARKASRPEQELRASKLRAEIAKNDAFAAERRQELAEANARTSAIDHQRTLMEAKSMREIEEIQRLEFQAQLEPGPRG